MRPPPSTGRVGISSKPDSSPLRQRFSTSSTREAVTREVTSPFRRFKIMSWGPSLRISRWAASEARRLCFWRKSRSKASRSLSSMDQKALHWLLVPRRASGTRRARQSAAARSSWGFLKSVMCFCQRSSTSTSCKTRLVMVRPPLRRVLVSSTTKTPRMRSIRLACSPRTHSRPMPISSNHRPFAFRSRSTMAKSSPTGGASSG